MNDEKQYHLINDYLMDRLQGRLLDEFKAKLKSDPQFAKEVEVQNAIIKEIQNSREKELRLYVSENLHEPYFKNQWGSKWTWASAAIVVFFVSTFFVIKFLIPDQNRTITSNEPADSASEHTITEDSATAPPDTNSIADNIMPSTPPELEIIEDNELAEETLLEDDINESTRPEMDMAPTARENTSNVDEEIKKDKFLSSKTFIIASVTPIFDTSVNISSAEISTDKITSKKQKSTSEEKDDDSDKEIERRFNAAKSRPIDVEFWQSPVNFRGYIYSKSSIQLFGIPESADLKFTELDNRLYMKVDNRHYFIEKNNKYNKLVEVTNPTLLKVLKD